MTDLKDIVFETDRYWVKRVPKGFEVYKTGLTHSARVAVIGYTGDKGLQRAKLEIERREVASGPSERHHATKKTRAQLQREIDEVLAQPRAHATMGTQKIPSFKISTKDPAAMTAAEINKELDKLNAQDSTLGSLMIEAGRGYERPSEYLKMTDPLAMELRKNSDRRQDLRIEISLRYGPNPPSRLPSGRGFGPRSSD